MLYLNPPFHIIEGVSLFADHADPLQYYYMPLSPHLTTVDDPTMGIAVPQIQLIKYRGDAGNGGFLNFDVNLGIEEDHLDDVRNKLRNIAELDDMPRLAPVPLIDGSVKLMLFGQESGFEPDPTAPSDQPRFVLQMNHAAKPALFGSNQAAFSVQLDEAGVVTAEKALQGELSPIGVVYSLEYLALRPAYSVRVRADWERVQHHLSESFGTNLLIFSSQTDKVVDELIEDRVIEIQVDSFIPPGEDAATLLGRLDQAVNEVKDMVLESFFEPSLDPIREEEDGWDKAAHVAERASLLHATGGLSGLVGFTRKNVDITRIDQKRLSVDMTERTTVKRSIYPQAHLQGLAHVLRDGEGEIDLDRFVIPVELNDAWFEERRITAIARTDFGTDHVEAITAQFDYGGEVQSVLLDLNQPQQVVTWQSQLDDEQIKREVTASYTVTFRQEDGTTRPLSLESVPETVTADHFEMRPQELYTKLPITLVALDFPWERYPHVEAQVRYTDNANGITIEDTFLLNIENGEVVWELFLRDPSKTNFDYKLIYRAADHQDVEMPWATTDTEQVTIRDPFPNKRRLQIVPALNWDDVSLAFVDTAYDDSENDVHEEDSFHFTGNNNSVATIEVPLVNPEHRFMTFRSTLIHQDGRVTESPPSVTLAPRVIITERMRGHRIIEVRPEAIPFEDMRISSVDVLLRYEDAEAGLSFLDSVTFRSHEDLSRYFEYDYANIERSAYEYQVTQNLTNGLQRVADWQSADLDTLIIEL